MFKGRKIVLTGSAGGIGQAIARRFVGMGAEVHGLDFDSAGQKRLADSLNRAELSPGRYCPHIVDLRSDSALEVVISSVSAALEGRCDVLVNNAGISRLVPFEQTDDSLLDLLLSVNFKAAFRITRLLLPSLLASGRGAVVNIASELALVGQDGYSAYSATKGALLAWSRALAIELAARGVRVNAVCPGPVDTSMLAAEFDSARNAVLARQAEIDAVPLGRLGQPRDIAAVVAFLASEEAAFVTGAAWSVDGGKTAR